MDLKAQSPGEKVKIEFGHLATCLSSHLAPRTQKNVDFVASYGAKSNFMFFLKKALIFWSPMTLPAYSSGPK